MRNLSWVALALLTTAACGEGSSQRLGMLHREKSLAQAIPIVTIDGDTNVRVVRPNAHWVSIFFGSINDVSRQVGLAGLPKSKLEPGSLEVRIWIGFGTNFLEGVVLRREQGTWSGQYIPPTKTKRIVALKEPLSGWKQLWDQLERLEITSLPDSSLLEDEEQVNDGTSYVFEIRTAQEYRTYRYSNPSYQVWQEARDVLAMDRVLRYELPEMSPPAPD